MNVYRTPADPGGFPFGYNWRATLTGLAFLVLFNLAATQYVAFRFHYQLALGKPLLSTRNAAIYEPFAWCIWGFRNSISRDPRIRKPLFEGEMMVLVGSMLSMFVFFAAANRRARRLSENTEDLHGSARWASPKDVDATGLAQAKAGVKELSGVLSTAKTALALYSDPLVAQNTSASDFTIGGEPADRTHGIRRGRAEAQPAPVAISDRRVPEPEPDGDLRGRTFLHGRVRA